MLISIIVTVRNEAKNMEELLDSFLIQEHPYEVIIIDAGSTDGTVEIVERYQKSSDAIKLIKHGGTRGECRNLGVLRAKGEALAFIDGDCIASKEWLSAMRKGLKKHDIVAGKTIYIGYGAFKDLERVELYYKGFDLTYPSCNLTYSKKAFLDAGGFDSWFVTAEDIDLNYRAVDEGHNIGYSVEAMVYHKTRGNILGFFKQAFWNGFGRKQLTMTHGRLWSNYKPIEMLRTNITFWYLFRLIIAMLGYVTCKIFSRKRPEFEKMNTSER